LIDLARMFSKGVEISVELQKEVYSQGECVEGKVFIKAGPKSICHVTQIVITLFAGDWIERGHNKTFSETSKEYKVNRKIRPKETTEIPFSFFIPNKQPITTGVTKDKMLSEGPYIGIYNVLIASATIKGGLDVETEGGYFIQVT